LFANLFLADHGYTRDEAAVFLIVTFKDLQKASTTTVGTRTKSTIAKTKRQTVLDMGPEKHK
jgi:hypothetical protein